RPGGSPLADEPAVLVELGDAIVVADAVGDVDVAGAIPRDVGRPVERRAGNSRAGHSPSAAAGSELPRGWRRTSCRRTRGRRRISTRARAAWGAATGFTTAAPRRRPHVDRFRLPSEHQEDPPVGGELHYLAGRFVDGPDVVLRIDPQ